MPPPSGFRLSLADRASIENGCQAGLSFTTIAAVIGKSASTISREVGGRAGRESYRAELAQVRAEDRAHRPKATKLEANPALRDRVDAGLEALSVSRADRGAAAQRLP